MYRIVMAVMLAAQIVGCSSGTTPEDRVRAIIVAVENAVEARSVAKVAEYFDHHYHDEYHRSQQAALRSLLGYFHRHRSIHLPLSAIPQISRSLRIC